MCVDWKAAGAAQLLQSAGACWEGAEQLLFLASSIE